MHKHFYNFGVIEFVYEVKCFGYGNQGVTAGDLLFALNFTH